MPKYHPFYKLYPQYRKKTRAYARVLILLGGLLLLTGCNVFFSGKKPHQQFTSTELSSANKLPSELITQHIFWQNSFMYLDGASVKNTPCAQALNGLKLYLDPKLSHDKRYVVYQYGSFDKIGIWDTVSKQTSELINASKDLPNNAEIDGVAFTSDNSKILFSYHWINDDGLNHSGLATVSIATRNIEKIHISDFQISLFDLDTSSDGKWAATDITTLDNQACFLIDLEMKQMTCLTFEKGWFTTVRFTPNSKYVVYGHNKKIFSPHSLVISKIDGTENRILASGFEGIIVLNVTNQEVVFAGSTYETPNCSSVYLINQDGTNLRELSYLGNQCFSTE